MPLVTNIVIDDTAGIPVRRAACNPHSADRIKYHCGGMLSLDFVQHVLRESHAHFKQVQRNIHQMAVHGLRKAVR